MRAPAEPQTRCGGASSRSDSSEQRLQQAIDQLLDRDHRQQQRRHRQQHGRGEGRDILHRERHQPNPLHDFEPVAQVGERLDVGTAQQLFAGRPRATEPLLIELPGIRLPQGAVLRHSAAPGGAQQRVEDDQRPEHDEYEHDHDADDFHLELGQHRAGMEDPVRDRTREHVPTASSSNL